MTTASEMVEKVARALHDEALARGETGSRRSWEKITNEEREGFRNLARAALSAIDSENKRLREALKPAIDSIRAALSSPPVERNVERELADELCPCLGDPRCEVCSPSEAMSRPIPKEDA